MTPCHNSPLFDDPLDYPQARAICLTCPLLAACTPRTPMGVDSGDVHWKQAVGTYGGRFYWQGKPATPKPDRCGHCLKPYSRVGRHPFCSRECKTDFDAERDRRQRTRIIHTTPVIAAGVLSSQEEASWDLN
jgi:predicted nucleic acid-binding Zn ribbon protein